MDGCSEEMKSTALQHLLNVKVIKTETLWLLRKISSQVLFSSANKDIRKYLWFIYHQFH